MRCEVLAIGTELLLGQIVDTNSAWIGEQLAASGIDSYEHRVIGDNQARIVAALHDLLVACRRGAHLRRPRTDAGRSDPRRDRRGDGRRARPCTMQLAETIATMFRARLRDMPQNNLRQADIPAGGDAIPNPIGTAPGLLCEVGDKVVFAVPGVPYEMQRMVTEHVIPDLLRRSGEASAIVSRSLKTWGTSESAWPRQIAHRLDALDERGGNPTIAFLARGIEGLVVRITAKAATAEEAAALVAEEEKELRAILGDLVFGVDDETMEHAVLARLRARGWSLGVAESLTGGLIGARIVNVPGASEAFRGTIGSYATDVKRSILGVTAESVVSEEAARADGRGCAARARRRRRHRGDGRCRTDRARWCCGRHGVLRARAARPADRSR